MRLGILFGKKLKDNEGEDSASFLPAMKSEKMLNVNERMIVHHSDVGIFAVRKGKWKLMLDNRGGSKRGNESKNPVINPADVFLFDMDNDEKETTNLSLELPEVVESLKKELAEMIVKGRSTPGKNQESDVKNPKLKWPEIDLIRQYIN